MFLLKLGLEGLTRRSLEIEGRVMHTTPRREGGFDLGIQYVPASTPRRIATTRFLDEVFREHLAKRKHVRMPVNLIAQDAGDPELNFLVRDLSRGGMGLRCPAGGSLPDRLEVGHRAELMVWHDGDEPFTFGASVVRLQPVREEGGQAVIGLCFDELSDANQRLLDALLYLHRPRAIQIRFLMR